MTRADLVIRSGKVVRSDSIFDAGIAITGGKIVGIMADHLLPPSEQVINARGKVVMAGVIDPHVHMREPGIVEREDWITGTMAAAAGGVTTVLDHPNSIPPVNCAEALLSKKEIIARKALIDFGLFGGAGVASIERIGEQAEAGAVAFKTFLWPYLDRKDEFEGLYSIDDDSLLDIFEAVALTGLVQSVHAESKAIVEHYTKKLIGKERRDPLIHGKSRPVLAEVEAICRAILLAVETGVRLNIAHISSGSAAALVKEARDKGYHNITGETCPHYLFLTEGRMTEIGPYAKVNPPLRSWEERERLWEYLLDGTISTLGSDHGPHLSEHKEKGWDDIFVAPAGSAGVETALPVMLTAVNQRKIDLQTLTKLMSEEVAKLYGLYPRKGVIQVGSDADLVIVDMAKETTIDRRKMYTKQKDAARMFDGWQAVGLPVMTIVRGTVIMQDGEVVGKPGYGQFISPLRTE
jgi:dihydropyrimidinase/allantoinase